MTIDTRRIPRSSRPVAVRVSTTRMKEDAGVNAPMDADKPYSWLERQYLRVMGVILARQLI